MIPDIKSNKRSIGKALVLAAVFSLVIADFAPAVPAPHDGGFLIVGFGFSPLARTSIDRVSDNSLVTDVTENGAALTVALGTVWNRVHSVELRWQNIFLSGDSDATQGVLALTYTRYLIQRGPSPFFRGGIGLQHGPFLGVTQRTIETSLGAAVLIGAGLRFNRRLSISADYSFGSTDKFFDNTFNYDFSHRQLVFSLQYTLLGG